MINKDHCKSDFRKSCINKLRFISSYNNLKKDKIIVNKLQEVIETLNAKKILMYIPMDIEVDILPLIHKLRQRGVEVFVPRMEGESFKAVKFRLPLHKKKFGIKEPSNSHLKTKIDLAIVPVVGIDGAGKRIGFGKGMYDRFFYALKQQPTIVFTQRTLCMTHQILSNQYDIQADYIITG
ncbi:5-formyltetrahydrofolate cyclo-ligase [Candidatus Marinarcus aquaticus]|uniref:5-formyltetrahydrofolate cyclo-ligase n=1 Tax=Candidatus Marinarcus aquaticus TaxID=2044504 RepID=UPI001D16FC4F|nr:5-formyltetrahydrofolate cyclo-ligase [Candidatus Marinarcus aquaticus]